MGLRISTNIASQSVQKNLKEVSQKGDSELEKLSSGKRITKSADDAAGLAIATNLEAQTKGLRQATRNANDGISLVQTAEGGLNETTNILVRLRELSVQSASDTIGDQERKFSDLEFKQLTSEVERIATSTQFNGKNLLSGEGDTMDFQIGIMNDAKNDRLSYRPQDSSARSADLGIAELGVATKEDAQTNLEKIDTAINNVNGNRATLGALQNRLQSTISNLEVRTENLAAANSRIRDTDIASESAEMMKNQILSQSSISVLAQANNSGSAALKLIG
jgi:flagellin